MNLIICTTPFQIIIAQNIMNLYREQKFCLLLIAPYRNGKYLFYYNKVIKENTNCIKLEYIKTLPKNYSKLFTLYDLLRLRFIGFFYRKYEKIFIANIESIWVQAFLSSLRDCVEIYTYDDGTANIIKSSFLYREAEMSFLSRLVLRMIGNKYSLSKLKKRSICHFSIYKNIPNIIENIKYLKLFPLDEIGLNEKSENNKSVNIFLGQPLYDYNPKLYEKLPKVIRGLEIDLYFPHPREKINLHNDIQYVDSNLIFEDYLFSELMGNKNTIYNVYTVYSGGILNLLNIPNVKLNAIKLDGVGGDLDEIYDFFSRLGINVIYV